MRRILLATDSDAVYDDVAAALEDTTTEVRRVRAGVDVVPACQVLEPDLIVLDLQIGNMGGMATGMAVRQEQQADRLAPADVLMLLDRDQDVFLARRSGADGWLVKPLDSVRLRRATEALASGETWREAVPEASANGF